MNVETLVHRCNKKKMNLESPQFVQKRAFPETQTPPSQPTESQISSPTTKQ
jgi:hypothetical protein